MGGPQSLVSGNLGIIGKIKRKEKRRELPGIKMER